MTDTLPSEGPTRPAKINLKEEIAHSEWKTDLVVGFEQRASLAIAQGVLIIFGGVYARLRRHVRALLAYGRDVREGFGPGEIHDPILAAACDARGRLLLGGSQSAAASPGPAAIAWTAGAATPESFARNEGMHLKHFGVVYAVALVLE